MNLRELTIERKRSGIEPLFSIGPKGNLHINKKPKNLGIWHINTMTSYNNYGTENYYAK